MKCRIGTRKSALARFQSESVAAQLERLGVCCELVEIVSQGDRDRTQPLYAMEAEAPGLFSKQLEDALLEGRIDLAVHSMKDLPTQQPEGLEVVAVPERQDPADWLLVHPQSTVEGRVDFAALREGAVVGTSSLRREALCLEARPDLSVHPLRGNVPSRVDQVRSRKLDAAILAAAGLTRLDLDLSDLIVFPLNPQIYVPAPAQGALAIEARADLPMAWRKSVRQLHNPKIATAVRIERKVLRDLEGGCTLPLGVLCEPQGERWRVGAFLGVTRNRAEPLRHWLSYHRFDISGGDEDTLVAETVAHFKALGTR